MLEAFDFTASVVEPAAVMAADEPSRSAIAREDLALLCEVGVMALAAERGVKALPVFRLLDREQPHNAAGPIGIAMIEASEGREREAFARLRRAIATREMCVREAKAVLCVLLIGFGRASEARLLRRELMRGPECGARRLVAAFGAC